MVEYEASPIPTKALKNKNAQKFFINDPTNVAAAQRLKPEKQRKILLRGRSQTTLTRFEFF